MISYGKQSIDKDDIKSVINCLKSNYLTQGPIVEKFEKKLSNYLGFKHCLGTTNGTSAMFLLSKLLKWKKGDLVAMPPITFLSTASIIDNCNAKPLFIDINLSNYSLCPIKLEQHLIKDKKKRIKAVVVTDFGGCPADWKKFYQLKMKYDIKLINDQCHSMGSKYYNSTRYAGKYCDFSTLSFHPVKTITTAEGGALLTNNNNLYRIAKLIRSHGIERSSKSFWTYKVNKPGYNLRISDLNCSLGLSQFKKINKFVKRRREIANTYNNFFSKYNLFKIPRNDKYFKNSYHLYPLLINFKKLKISKQNLISYFLKKGIKLQVHYVPVNSQPYFKKKFKLNKNEFKNSFEYFQKTISLPIYYDLNNISVNKVILLFKKLIRNSKNV